MAAATFMTDLVEIATQAIEAAAGIGSLINGFEAASLANKYYNLYAQQKQFYYNVFQNGLERNIASQAYSEPFYVLNYAGRANSAYLPSGPLESSATDVYGWIARNGGMFTTGIDSRITELEVDKARVEIDWVNYLYRFEEAWADIRNDARWAHRLTVHNIAIKQGTAVSSALEGALDNYVGQTNDMASMFAGVANGVAKYAGYKRGLKDVADEFERVSSVGTNTPLPTTMPIPEYDANQITDLASTA